MAKPSFKKRRWPNSDADLIKEKIEVQSFFRGFSFSRTTPIVAQGILVSNSGTTYAVQMTYPSSYPRGDPKVRITSPQLKPNPHQYGENEDYRLCLFDWRKREWDGARMTGETILLWVAEWIFCYEVYCKFGIWPGAEAEHGLKDSRQRVLPATNVGQHGRNERCPCGSGKKYKKCCGQGS